MSAAAAAKRCSRCATSVYDGELGEAPVLLLHTDMTEFGGDTEESDLNLEKPLILPPYSGMLLRI